MREMRPTRTLCAPFAPALACILSSAKSSPPYANGNLLPRVSQRARSASTPVLKLADAEVAHRRTKTVQEVFYLLRDGARYHHLLGHAFRSAKMDERAGADPFRLRRERGRTFVDLDGEAILVELKRRGGLARTDKLVSRHEGVRPRDQGLHHVAGTLHSSVPDHLPAVEIRDRLALRDRGDLRGAHAYLRGAAHVPPALIHLYRVRPPLKKMFRSQRGRNVADDKRQLEALLDLLHGLLGVHGTGARGVDQERRDPLFRLRFDFAEMLRGEGAADADRADAKELALPVPPPPPMIRGIEQAVRGDESCERSLCIDKRQFFDAVLAENFSRPREGYPVRRGDERADAAAAHELVNQGILVGLIAPVAAREHAHGAVLRIHDNERIHVKFAHHLLRILEGAVQPYAKRLLDESGIGAADLLEHGKPPLKRERLRRGGGVGRAAG